LKSVISRCLWLGLVGFLAACSDGKPDQATTQNEPVSATQAAGEAADPSVPLQPQPTQTQSPQEEPDQAAPVVITDAGDSSDSSTTPVPASDDTESDASAPAASTEEPAAVDGDLVEIDIEVPTYVSDRLQLRVFWGDQEMATQWVSDQSWLASMFIPFHVTQRLLVTFYDRDGEIILGTVEGDYINLPQWAPPKIYQFNFVTDRYDDDNDGVSNIDELRLGTNPLIHYQDEQPSVDLSRMPRELIDTLAGFQLEQLAVIVEDLMLVMGQTTTIAWPDSDYYQVQEPETFESVCDGGAECRLLPGEYTVTNHTTGETYPLEVEAVDPVDVPGATLLPEQSYLIEGDYFFTESAPMQRTEYVCENGGTLIKELVDATPVKRDPPGYNFTGEFERHGYIFNQCSLTLDNSLLPDGTYTIDGVLNTEYRYYGGYGDHIEQFTYNGFSITGDNGLEYRVQGETKYRDFEGGSWDFERNTTVSEFFKKLPGNRVGESITDVNYSYSFSYSQSPAFIKYSLDVNGEMQTGLTGGQPVNITTVSELNGYWYRDDYRTRFNGEVEMRNEDGSVLNIQGNPFINPEQLFFLYVDIDYVDADGVQSNSSQVRHIRPSQDGPYCRTIRKDGERIRECMTRQF